MESESAWEWRAIDKRVSVESDYLNAQINANRVDMGSVHVTPAMAMAEIEDLEWITKMPEEDSGDVLFGAEVQAYDPSQKRGEAGTPDGGRWVKEDGAGASDADYLAAVEAGDTEAAQAMVDEAAKAAGYDRKAYHGTDVDTIDVFDKSKSGKRGSTFGDGFYFTSKREDAEKHGSNVISSYLKTEKTFNMDDASVEGSVEYGLADTNDENEFVKNISQAGYDSVYVSGGDSIADEVVVFSPNQIKSADPVTYDPDGNVIPLSKRFDDKDDRITFSNAKP